jgi:hypothetical protein
VQILFLKQLFFFKDKFVVSQTLKFKPVIPPNESVSTLKKKEKKKKDSGPAAADAAPAATSAPAND